MFSRAVRRPSAWRLATAAGRAGIERQRVAVEHGLQVGADGRGSHRGVALRHLHQGRRRAGLAQHQQGLVLGHRVAHGHRVSAATRPSRGALTSCSIFMASSTRSSWPARTVSPEAAQTWTTVADIGARMRSFMPGDFRATPQNGCHPGGSRTPH